MKHFLLLFIAIPIGLCAQESFKVKRGEIVFTSFSESDASAVNAVEDAKFKEVIIDKTMEQKDFDLLCTSLDWITKMEIKSRNKAITNINAISNLKALEEFVIDGLTGSEENALDLVVFSGLSNLKKLNLRSTKVKNTDALKTTTQLEELLLFKSDAPSLDFMANTPELKTVDLFGNTVIEDYSPLAQLKKLEELVLTFNSNLTDEHVSSLEAISSLKSIDLPSCSKLTTLNFLKNNTGLERLNIRGCRQLADFSALANISTLKFINAGQTQLKNLDDLAQNKSIENFKIRDTEVSNIDMLQAWDKLKELDLSDTQVTNLTPIAECENLRSVTLINCKIEDLAPLANAPELRTLILINGGITDISALSNNPELTFLEIQDNEIADLSPLLNGEKLRRLTVSSTMPEAQLDPLKKKFAKLKVVVKD